MAEIMTDHNPHSPFFCSSFWETGRKIRSEAVHGEKGEVGERCF